METVDGVYGYRNWVSVLGWCKDLEFLSYRNQFLCLTNREELSENKHLVQTHRTLLKSVALLTFIFTDIRFVYFSESSSCLMTQVSQKPRRLSDSSEEVMHQSDRPISSHSALHPTWLTVINLVTVWSVKRAAPPRLSSLCNCRKEKSHRPAAQSPVNSDKSSFSLLFSAK